MGQGESELDRALLTFGHGFAIQRSQKEPYEFMAAGPLWILRDPLGTKQPRNTEVLVYGISGRAAREAVRKFAPARHSLAVVHQDPEDEESVRAFWRASGYRPSHREPFFVTSPVPESDPAEFVRRVTTPEEAEKVREAAKARQIGPKELADGSVRLYAAWRDDMPVGWVKSIRTPVDQWVGNLYVKDEHRRQGAGEALMRALLAGDAEEGVERSFLLASSSGTRLYPKVGYRQIGMLQVLTQTERPD